MVIGKGTSYMKLGNRTHEDIEFIEPEGDMRSGKDLEEIPKLVQRLVDEGKRKIVLNMELVPYIDSAGLGAILRCCIATRRVQGIFKLLKPSERVLEIFEVTRMSALLQWYAAEENLMKSFSSRDGSSNHA
jgi:anti-sigma B factor antagonist